MSRVDKVLDFWFGSRNDACYGKERSFWFSKSPRVDWEILTRFKADYQQAAAGKLDYWKASPESCLALIILLDQFPRNMFRGSWRAFTTDPQALAAAQHAIAEKFDRELLMVQCWFIYLPFQHSEDIDHQYKSVELFRQLGEKPENVEAISYAIQHLEIIKRFGKFPHRNSVLGRATTPEEAEFLKQAGSLF
jgi:uncharacterized protein (DUF924 family)